MSEEQKDEFERIAKMMMKFLCDHGHPHMSVVIDCNTAQLSEGTIAIQTNEFIRD